MSHRRPCLIAAAIAAGAVLASAACTPIEPRAQEADARALLDAATELSTDRSTGLFYYRPDVVPLEVGARVPDYAWTELGGDPSSLGALQGKTVVVTFFESRSPDTELCPALLLRIGRMWDTLRTDLRPEVELLAVTVDPDHDTGTVVRDWKRRAGIHERLRFARADPETTARLATNLGLALWRRDDGSIGHTLATVIIDRRGRIADTFAGLTAWSTSDLLASVVATARR